MDRKEEQIEKAIRSARASIEAEGYQLEEEWINHTREKIARNSEFDKKREVTVIGPLIMDT